MGIGALTLNGKDNEDDNYMELLDTHGGLTIWVHQCYEKLGIDLKVSEAVLMKEYLESYIATYQNLLENDQ